MMGRLGCVVGANIVGLLLDNYCQLAFSMSGTILICKRREMYVEKIFEMLSNKCPNSMRYLGLFHTERPRQIIGQHRDAVTT